MESDDRRQDRRAIFIKGTLYTAFFILLFRFFHLQVLSGALYRERSERNHVRQIPIMPSRGRIYDRHGQILVDNRPSYSLYIVPYEFNKNPVDAAVISSIIGLSVDDIMARIDEKGNGPFTPVRLIRDMRFEMLSNVEEHRLDLRGVFYQVEPVRTYPSNIRAPHVLGYVGEISNPELKLLKDRNYYRGDSIGKSGVEKSYNAVLKGQRGYRYVEVDVKGREVGNFDGARDVPSVQGRSIRLTLDATLQAVVEDLMDGKRGAVVVLDPTCGDVLAMASAPDYSLEPFANGISPEIWSRLMEDPDRPLLHRAVQAQLPPGSTYKLALMVAALQEGKIDPDDETTCPGYLWLGRRMFHCWQPDGHGSVNLLDALKVSCNVYFYRLGLRVGIDAWARSGRKLGFGAPTEIDLTGESSGLLPDRGYLNEKYGEKGWSKGMLANLSVGQGDLLVTPTQMVQLAAVIATGGKMVQPRLVRWIQDDSPDSWVEKQVKSRDVRGISLDVFHRVKEGMFRVVNHPGGTGGAARIPRIEVCGKTGTAQNPHGEDHAWFIGFAPRDDPKIALAVVVENGGSGGAIAAPIAGRIFRWFFRAKGVS